MSDVMRFWWLVLLVVGSSCKAPCEQPIEAFCTEFNCGQFDSYLGATEVWDGGACPNFSRATCGEQVVVLGGTVAQFFAPDGGRVAAVQRSDAPTACGSDTRTWGTVPDCTLENETRYCANR